MEATPTLNGPVAMLDVFHYKFDHDGRKKIFFGRKIFKFWENFSVQSHKFR